MVEPMFCGFNSRPSDQYQRNKNMARIEAKVTYTCPTSGSTCVIDLKNIDVKLNRGLHYRDEAYVDDISVNCECGKTHYFQIED